MDILGEAGVQKLTNPLAKYERYTALILIWLIEQGIGADDILWPRMFFRARVRHIRSLAFSMDQGEGADIIAIRTKDEIGIPIQVKVLERGYGATKFKQAHPNVPIVYTGKWETNPPEYAKLYLISQTAHIINDSPPELWRHVYYKRYTWMRNHLPWHLRS